MYCCISPAQPVVDTISFPNPKVVCDVLPVCVTRQVSCEEVDEFRAKRSASFVRKDFVVRTKFFFVHFERHRNPKRGSFKLPFHRLRIITMPAFNHIYSPPTPIYIQSLESNEHNHPTDIGSRHSQQEPNVHQDNARFHTLKRIGRS